MAEDKYTRRTEEDREALNQLEIRQLEHLVAALPPEKRREPTLVIGNRTFTPEQLLQEAKEGSEYGKLYLKMRSNSRLERLKRGR
ncbi:MAG: hypothetical protein JXB35_14290 [Anaerolineae bacterium]|nr:hypothetical protein [Anaerolineae bacterium]